MAENFDSGPLVRTAAIGNGGGAGAASTQTWMELVLEGPGYRVGQRGCCPADCLIDVTAAA